jgi:transcriptional regulator with XRE-family HTH domain
MVECKSLDSHSPLMRVFEQKEFRRATGNDVAFKVAMNLISLRKYRGMSQARVAKLVGTSQAKVARIEGANENITLQTLRRFSEALRGRIRIAVEPEELSFPSLRPWWEAVDTGLASDKVWHLTTVAHNDKDPSGWVLAGWKSEDLEITAGQSLICFADLAKTLVTPGEAV